MTQAKIYTFSAEPTAFDPVIAKLDKIAIEQNVSRSRVIANILLDHFGMSNNNDLRKMDYSRVLAGRLNRS